jgi:hypothetical protein
MATIVACELLDHIPVSGSVTERHFHSSADSNTWVSFDEGERRWVGVFGNSGLAHFSAAVPFPDNPSTILVIAMGQGYIVDGNSGTLIRKTPWDYAYSAWGVPDRDFLVVADDSQIWITDRRLDIYAKASDSHVSLEKDLSRVAHDGIVFQSVTAEGLSGMTWQYAGWYNFRLDFKTMTVIHGERAPESEDFKAIPGRGGFPLNDAYIQWMKRFFL